MVTPAFAKATTEDLATNSSSLTVETIPSKIIIAQNEDSSSTKPTTEDKESILCMWRICFVNKIEKIDRQENALYYGFYPSFWGHALLVIASGVMIGSTFLILNVYANYLSRKWIDGISKKNPDKFSLENTKFPENIHDSIKKNPYYQSRLEQQLEEIQIRISRHKEFMLYFYRQHFLSISMASGLALVAGICVIFVAEEGIGDANPALMNIFITTASAALLYQRIPGIFQQELNREANRSLFLKYSDLGNTILSYLATGKIRNNLPITNQAFASKLDADKFVHFIDQELARFNQLPIEFDATKVIKITDLSESINGSFNGDETTPEETIPEETTPNNLLAKTTSNREDDEHLHEEHTVDS
ncbi:MAG: hypothetical protein AAGA80_17335 [Cyanobacteria bacterium P01_F01_bin.143]